MITLSSIASSETQDVIIVPCSNLPTVPYGFGRQLPIYQSKRERSEPAAQSIENLRNNGGSKPYSTKAWRKNKAPNHRSCRNRHRCPPPRWTSVQLRDGRHHILRRMAKHRTLMMNPREFICYPLVLPPAATSHPEKKLSLRASARRVDSCFLKTQTSQACHQQTKNSWLKISYEVFTIFSIIENIWFVVVTYQTHAFMCKSHEPYVVVTYRSSTFIPCKSTYRTRTVLVYWPGLWRSSYRT